MLRGWWLAIGVMTLTLASPVAARMNAADFLARAGQLQRRGPLALFSSDLKRLQNEAETAGDELKAEHDAAKAAHQPLAYCTPNRKVLGAQELLDGLRRIPAAELRRLDIKQAMHAILVHNYPC